MIHNIEPLIVSTGLAAFSHDDLDHTGYDRLLADLSAQGDTLRRHNDGNSTQPTSHDNDPERWDGQS